MPNTQINKIIQDFLPLVPIQTISVVFHSQKSKTKAVCKYTGESKIRSE